MIILIVKNLELSKIQQIIHILHDNINYKKLGGQLC
jgi:hypothetical protein